MERGQILNGALAAQGQPVVQQLTPANDIQIVGLMASNFAGDPRTRVNLAIEILAEAFLAVTGGVFAAKVREIQEKRAPKS